MFLKTKFEEIDIVCLDFITQVYVSWPLLNHFPTCHAFSDAFLRVRGGKGEERELVPFLVRHKKTTTMETICKARPTVTT